MSRMIISLGDDEKAWLDKMAKAQHISMAEIIRKAIKEYRKKNRAAVPTDLDQLLEKTRGIWPEKDGLSYQKKIRDEWDSR